MEMMQLKTEFKITTVFFKWKLIKNASYSEESILIISWLRLVWLLVALIATTISGSWWDCSVPLATHRLSPISAKGGLQRDKLQFIQEK